MRTLMLIQGLTKDSQNGCHGLGYINESVAMWIHQKAEPCIKTRCTAWHHDTTKNKKEGHCKVTLTRDAMCSSTWFQMAVHHHADAGRPITNQITSSGHWEWESSSLLRSQ